MKTKLEILQNESGREGVHFNVRSNKGTLHEVYLQPINLENDRSVKIPKSQLGKSKENLWVALVLFMKEIEPTLYLIPSMILTKPDDYIFIDNEQSANYSNLSNWEIKVFTKAIPILRKYALLNMVGQLQENIN